jgi:serine O-acetyltransferase
MIIWWEDVGRTYRSIRGTRLVRLINCLRAPGVHAVTVLRFGQWSRRQWLPLRVLCDPVYILLDLLLRMAWGIEIPRAASIGPGLYISHFGGIVISSAAVIGRNAAISQGITIGVSGQGDKAGVPMIGDDVYIAPGACLFGRIRVGNNVKIGANSVVYRDIPDNAIVVLDPGYRIVSMKGNLPLSPADSESASQSVVEE